MSDRNFPFAGSGASAYDAPSTGPNKKLLAGVGVLVTAVALGAAAWLLTSGDDSSSLGAPVPSARHAVPKASASPSASAPDVAVVDAGGGRNPFISQLPNAPGPASPVTAPVVTAPVVTNPGTGTGTGTGTVPTTPVVPTVPGTVPGTVPTVPGTVPGTIPGTVPAGVTTFKVVAVASDDSSVTVLVNGLSVTAAPGASLDTAFSVLRLEGGTCGSFSHGTQKFDMCEGASTTFS